MTKNRTPAQRGREWPALGFVADNHRQGADNASQSAAEKKRARHDTGDDQDYDEYEYDKSHGCE